MAYATVFDHAAFEESHRLALLGEAVNPGTFRRLDRLGLPADARCLDIGSGTGHVATRLRQLCPGGSVLATDRDVRNLEPGAGVDVLRHDVTIDTFPDESFDAIVVRWVLAHLPRPTEVLATIAGWLAPGGVLLVEDPADFAMRSSPDDDYRDVSMAVNHTLSQLAGTDLGWARTFPRPLVEVGLERVGLDADATIVGPGTPMAAFMAASTARITDPLLAGGLTTRRQLSRWHSELASTDYWDLGLVNVAGWGYRPAS
jgi:SAM-dependent methyltransferase